MLLLTQAGRASAVGTERYRVEPEVPRARPGLRDIQVERDGSAISSDGGVVFVVVRT